MKLYSRGRSSSSYGDYGTQRRPDLLHNFDKLPPLEKQEFNRENGCLIQSIRNQQAELNKKHLELEKIAQSYHVKEECKAKEKMEAKEQHLSQILSKIRRINIRAGGLQRRMENFKMIFASTPYF